MADNKLRFFLTGDSKQFQQSLTQAENKLKAFGSKMQSVGRSMTMFAAPVVAAGAASIKMAASFDKSMTKIKTLVGVAADEVDSMRAGVMKMAKDTGSSADEAAEALFFITSAGIKGDEAMKVLNASLKASAIGLGEVATVADSATSAMNAYGSENLSATMATDVLTNSVRLGKLSSEELAGSIGQVIPIASNLGVQFHEVGATLAAMSRTGTNAATASMQLKNILISILKPSKEGADQLAAMGLSSQKLRQQIKDEGLLSVLTTLKGRFEENEDAQAKVFGSSRALMGVMDLLGKGFKDTEQIFADMAKSAGVTAEAYEELQNSAEFKLRKSMVQVKETFREVGATLLEALLPAIQSASEFIVKLLKGFNGLSDNTKTFLGIVTMLATALGPLLIVFGSLITSVGTIIGAIKSSTIAMKLLNLAMSANPAIKFATIILGAAAALFKLGKARKEAQMEALNKELNDLSIEDAEKRLASLSTTLAANTKIIDDNNKLSFSRRKHLLEDADGNRVATRKIVSKNKAMGNEIQMLKEIIQKKKDMAKADEEIANITTLGTTTGGGGGGTGTSGPTPEDIAKQTAAALLTTKKKQFDAEIAATKSHYNNLIKLNEGNGDIVKQLEISKNEKLKQINDGYNADAIRDQDKHDREKAALKTAIEDASAVTDEQRKALEVQRTKEFYDKLIEQAKEFELNTDALVAARAEKIKQLGETLNETTKEFTETQKLMGEGLESVFQGIGISIAESMGGAGSALSGFLSTFLSGAMQFVAASLAQSLGLAVTAAGQSALDKGPFAAFVLPALIAGTTAAVSGAFKKIPKFASGGIVSTPTMGLMGEYPGARSNPEVIAPLDKLTGMLGGTQSNVQVGGEFKLRGQDLVVALQRADRNRERIK